MNAKDKLEADVRRKAFADTELCVKCGLCLPHCPTYGKTLDENESPRGRLSLIQAWAAGSLKATPKLLEHVDNCLLCRACESACPANVPYGKLVDDFRAATSGHLPVKPLGERMKAALVDATLHSRGLQRLSGPTRTLLSKTGLLKSAGLGDLEAGLPAPFKHEEWRGFHPALGAETTRVSLFLGCTAELADAETVTAAIRLLTRLGVSVTVPSEQDCCGAMALHSGDHESASRMQRRNLTAFQADGGGVILTLASGCGAVLREYPKAPAFGRRIKDICHFLAEYAWPEAARFEPLSAKALIHSPCSLMNVLKSDRYPRELLRRIPALQVKTLPKTTQCCGAAGTYMLEHPAMAKALRDDVLTNVEADAPDYLLTSNVGCAIHLRSGLKLRGLPKIQVLHPLVLLERQLRT